MAGSQRELPRDTLKEETAQKEKAPLFILRQLHLKPSLGFERHFV